MFCAGGELASRSIDHMNSPQTTTVEGTQVNVSNFTNLINSKLKAFRDREEEKDVLDLEFLVNAGKNKYKTENVNQNYVKILCENYPEEMRKNKSQRKKIVKGLENEGKLKKLGHACTIQ